MSDPLLLLGVFLLGYSVGAWVEIQQALKMLRHIREALEMEARNDN